MNALSKIGLAVLTAVAASQALAQVTFYEQDDYQGRSFIADGRVGNFEQYGFSDRAASAIVQGSPREVCEDNQFRGRCVILRPGGYPSLAAMGLNRRVSSVRLVDAPVAYQPTAPAIVPGQLTLYEHDGWEGQSFIVNQRVANLDRSGFNDRASSATVLGTRWQVCQDMRFEGRCVVLRPGRYPSLASMGLNDRISSVRPIDANARVDDALYAPLPPQAVYDNRLRRGERLYDADVTSVRAVVGTPEQRCWVERGQVSQETSRGSSNVPGALAGAILGGILGHQVGNGRGNDLATIGGAVAGGAIGSNVGRNNETTQARAPDVRRCEDVPASARPDYWDVTYVFRGQEHRVQMTSAPGETVTVNDQGEPRS